MSSALYKTGLCRWGSACKDGIRCPYYHSQEERRYIHGKGTCRWFQRHEKCRHWTTDSCSHIHSHEPWKYWNPPRDRQPIQGCLCGFCQVASKQEEPPAKTEIALTVKQAEINVEQAKAMLALAVARKEEAVALHHLQQAKMKVQKASSSSATVFRARQKTVETCFGEGSSSHLPLSDLVADYAPREYTADEAAIYPYDISRTVQLHHRHGRPIDPRDFYKHDDQSERQAKIRVQVHQSKRNVN